MAFKITPKGTARVRHPNGGPVLTAEGTTVEELSSYWVRRRLAEEVEIATIVAPAAPAADEPGANQNEE